MNEPEKTRLSFMSLGFSPTGIITFRGSTVPLNFNGYETIFGQSLTIPAAPVKIQIVRFAGKSNISAESKCRTQHKFLSGRNIASCICGCCVNFQFRKFYLLNFLYSHRYSRKSALPVYFLVDSISTFAECKICR